MDSSHDEANIVVQQKDGEEDADPAKASNSVGVLGASSAVEDVSSPVSETVNSSLTSETETNKSVICLPEDSVVPSHEKIESHSEKSLEKGDVTANVSDVDPCKKRTEVTEETTKPLEIEGKALQDKVMTSNIEDVENEPVVGASSKRTKSIDTSNVEESTSGQSLVIADNLRQPDSPYSDKEIDLSEERVLMIDESEASHSESAANVSEASHSESAANVSKASHSESAANVSEASHSEGAANVSESSHSESAVNVSEASHSEGAANVSEASHSESAANVSETSHSESAANVSQTSSGILDSYNIEEAASTAKDTTEKADTGVEGSTKEATTTVSAIYAPIVSSISSIEESIERCIANYSCESSEEMSDRQSGAHSPSIFPKRKRSAAVIADRFPYNYGFKIITNKIDLSASPRGAFNTISKLQEGSSSLPSNISVKRIKFQGKSLLEYVPQAAVSEESKEQENADKETLSSKSVANINNALQKSTEEPSEKVTPKERPTIGLKVRDVESINAAIRNVKAAPNQVFPEETNNISNSSAIEKGLPDEEITSQANDKNMESGPDGPSIVCKSSLRSIAPKCDPIASNDLQAIKMIRDLIQLPSIPVYVPDVADSKHFNGRLHLCHGCGDRFVLLKSLLEHQNRRSCVIKFQCLKCDSAVLCFFNRCEFIRHLYNHNQTLTTVMLQYHIAVERLPPQNSGIFDVRICQECKVILKVPLSDHMQCPETGEERTVDLALKCQWCSLLLPTRCAYQAHRRMHFLQAPHVCPECGDMSPDLPSFNIHINSVCFHTSKRSLFQCTHCKAEMYDARKLERHVRERHIRDVYKCNFCFVACFNLKDLEKHRQHNHQEKVEEEPKDDDDKSGLKYAFHLCDMCPNRLIRRVRLGQHVLNHTYSHAEIRYAYECRVCKSTFSSREVLSDHATVCLGGNSSSNSQAVTAVVPNGTDILVEQPQTVTSDPRVPFVFETPPPVTDSRSSEVQADCTDTVMIPRETSYPDEDDVMVMDGADLPPPLQKGPVTQRVTQQIVRPVIQHIVKPVTQQIVQPVTQPVNPPAIPAVTLPVTKPSNSAASVPEKKKKKKKKKASKKSPLKIVADHDSPKEDQGCSSFEQELFMDGGSLDVGEDAMEVVLNCLDCGTNLTSELGSYCTLCEQKREAGDMFNTASPNPLLTASSKPLLNVAKKKLPKKPTSGNYSCRICNALISKTCDKAAIKRHFILKHKQIFIAALKTGLNIRRSGKNLTEEQVRARIPDFSPKESEKTVGNVIAAQKSQAASLSKLSPRKKKKARKPVSESDTDDDDPSFFRSSPSRESKKSKEKRKKSYSPAFPALEQGMVAPDERSSETNENTRTCYKCSFKSVDKDEFMTHVATHKTNPKDLQCPACGMCFVVRPSLEKHVLISHGIQNGEEYLLEHGFSPVAKVPEDVDMLDVNQCKVCQMKFDSEALLEKHFRTHGSAFLLSKQFRRSS